MKHAEKLRRRTPAARATRVLIGVAASVGLGMIIDSSVVLACFPENGDETWSHRPCVMEAAAERTERPALGSDRDGPPHEGAIDQQEGDEPDGQRESGFDVGVGTSGPGWVSVWLAGGSRTARWQVESWYDEGRSEYDEIVHYGSISLRDYRYVFGRHRAVQFLFARGFRVDRRFSTRFVVGAGYEGNPDGYICNAVGYPKRQVVCDSLERDGQHGFGIVGYGVDASIGSRFYLRAEARFVFFGRRRGGARPIILPVLGAGVRF